MKNTLYFGDNLEILKDLYHKHPEGFIDLIYIDPPFNSKRDYNILFEDIDLKDVKAQKEAFKDTWSNVTYIDTLNEIKGLDLNLHSFLHNLDQIGIAQGEVSYLTMMAIRTWYMYKLLNKTGSFYLHCDPTMSHYLKIVCDLIFGEKHFKNEIIWHYRRWTGLSKSFQKLHDIILFYTKSDQYNFNIQYTAYTEGSVERKLQGVLHRFKEGDDPVLISEKSVDYKGVRENDVWQIPFIAPSAKERLGYPTQKPLKLLDRIIKASSNEGDLVADFFCGCGTTIAAAQNLKRKWLGVDISHLAIKLVLNNRLLKEYEENPIKKKEFLQSIEIEGFPKDIASAKSLAIDTKGGRFKFEAWIIEVKLDGVLNQNKNQTGFDGYLTFDVNGDKDVCFIEVKSGGANLPQLHHFIQIVEEREADMGVFVCFKEQVTSGMEKAAKQQGHYKEKRFGNSFDKIQIISVEDLLEHKSINMPQSTVGTFKSAKKTKEKAKQEGIF